MTDPERDALMSAGLRLGDDGEPIPPDDDGEDEEFDDDDDWDDDEGDDPDDDDMSGAIGGFASYQDDERPEPTPGQMSLLDGCGNDLAPPKQP